MDVAAVVASAKRFIPRPEHRVQLEDLVISEIQAARTYFDGPAFDQDPVYAQRGEPFFFEYKARVARYEAASSRLVGLATALAHYGSDDQFPLIATILRRLANYVSPYETAWSQSRLYPAYLVFYSVGTALIAQDNLAKAVKLLRRATVSDSVSGKQIPVVNRLMGGSVLGTRQQRSILLADVYANLKEPYSPLDDYLAILMPRLLESIVHDPVEVDVALIQFHYLAQLAYVSEI